MRERPVIFEYQIIGEYIGEMLKWRKDIDAHFSIRSSAQKLTRCSPSLISLIIKQKRKLTSDRIADIAKLLCLSGAEKRFLETWVKSEFEKDSPHFQSAVDRLGRSSAALPERKRKTVTNLLTNWLNPYVKDASRLKGFLPDAFVIHRLLGGIASVQAVDSSLKFLLREGYLRFLPNGKVVEDTPLIATTDGIPNSQIRRFHKKALALAQDAIELWPVEKRLALALTMTLNKESFEELRKILQEFFEKLIEFSENHSSDNEQLYQIILNLSPIGGKNDEKKSEST